MNIFDMPELQLMDESVNILIENKNIRIERIISTGQTSGWYDQEETEFVILLSGDARLEFENGNMITLIKGDTLLIYPHQKHRVSYTSSVPPCLWLCIFY